LKVRSEVVKLLSVFAAKNKGACEILGRAAVIIDFGDTPVKFFRKYAKHGQDGKPLVNEKGRCVEGSADAGEFCGVARLYGVTVGRKNGEDFCIADSVALPREYQAEILAVAMLELERRVFVQGNGEPPPQNGRRQRVGA
jgi:hypothetical protein